MSRAALSVYVLVVCSYAQINFATLSGIIEDPQRRPVQQARVQLKSAATGAVRSVVTGPEGIYQFASLAPGEYELNVEAAGFAVLTRRLRVEVGQQIQLDLALALGQATESVDVVGTAELIKTADASLGEVVEQQSIRELPLNGRMLLDLVLLVPASHHSHGAQRGDMNPLYWRPGQPSALSIGGNRPNANYFLLDGATNTDPTFNTQNLSLSPDAVLEFKVQTGSYSAELGGAGGGQINIITRSGTSKFHGTVYTFLRNDAMDARNFNEMEETKHLTQNNFGAAAGGPLPGGNTFFFANYEGLRKVKAMTAVATVPTAMEAMGDFSEAGVNIFNPFSSRNNPDFDPSRPAGPTNPRILRDPFPENRLPESLISPVASLMLNKYVPRPNTTGHMGMGMSMMGVPVVVGTGIASNNYLDVRKHRHAQDQGTLRLDRILSGGDMIFGRYSASRERGFTPENLPGFGAFHNNMAQHLTVSWNHILSPSAVNTALFAISRLAMHRSSENNDNNDIVSELGIEGVGFGGKGAYGAPWFAVQGYSGFGDSYAATPVKQWDTLYEGRNTLSWQHGRHGLKFGAAYRHYVWPMWGFFQNRGYYQFTNGFTTRTATSDGTGSALASFLLGLPALRQRQAGIPSMDLRQWYADAFAQDSWRVTANTTLEFGVRYEYMSPLRDIARAWSNLLVGNGRLQAVIGGQEGLPRGLMFANKKRFAPRFGVSHHVSSVGLVLHAAYGIFYTPVDMNTWCNQLHNVPLVFPETNQSDNFIPSILTLNFGPAVLGRTVVSFTAFDPRPPAQYIQQWSASVEKSLGAQTTLEVGYRGARGFHLQRSHLINNAPPGPGLIQPRRPYQTASFSEAAKLPDNITVASRTFPVSAVNILENTARSWYDAGYVNVRRRYSSGLGLLANYTFAKNLSDAPAFRSPMFESAVPQDNNNLRAEKGPACDIRHRFALSAVYELPEASGWRWSRAVTRGWRLSAIYQVQSGFPFTISVFGDTANAGTILGENPIRANYTGAPVFGPGTRTAERWFNPEAFATPPPYTFGNVGRNSVYGPGMQTLDIALVREFALSESARLQFRGELFNALNHTNLGIPNRFVNTPQFGTITEAATPNREVQLSLRLSF
ncbi:MAG TPA: carboxypeptidase regulatory-like domain-containing protein [Bryobacteraceae bacterium]|nr:carboxypeptidase regulatory-like domain-containing protein [Bryobacteraceae bacterium]